MKAATDSIDSRKACPTVPAQSSVTNELMHHCTKTLPCAHTVRTHPQPEKRKTCSHTITHLVSWMDPHHHHLHYGYTHMLKKRNREMHTHHVSIHAIWAICPQLAISDTFRHVPDTFLHVPRPWFTFRILPPTLPSLSLSHIAWIIETTSSIYTFLNVPCYPSIGSLKSCPESIRSCTFCATLPIIL